MLKINQTYKHYKNKESYIIKDFCKIQENDVWVNAIIYTPKNEDKLFVRSEKEFIEKFK
ncbi:MAG: DUF1653 domain-containing protein [Campylobacteraceae bacterium]|nr:DUF1653 domain-containing protein [Campylobacteraceae bacterium]